LSYVWRPGHPARKAVKAPPIRRPAEWVAPFYRKGVFVMAKIGKRSKSNWTIGAHTVNSYKARVPDPAVKRKRRTSREIRRVISQALNRVQDNGRTVYLCADSYKGNPKPKTLYRVELFKDNYYVLCIQKQVVTLFTSEMIAGDARRGGLVFRDEAPFEELTAYYAS
jgi:hypothetical protein